MFVLTHLVCWIKQNNIEHIAAGKAKHAQIA